MPGHDHGNSIKNPKVYEALRREGMPKSRAAAISNAARGGAGRSARAVRSAGAATGRSVSGRRR